MFSDEIVNQYVDFFVVGFYVVILNKKVNIVSMSYYYQLCNVVCYLCCKLMYEIIVGVGLFVIENL